jgi:uncharacterized membrane protein YeaQ/YmgE (transglycosylase-associated protein family)
MSFLVWVIVGIVVGSLGSQVMRCDADRGTLLPGTLAGILGALLAGWLVGPFLDGSSGRGFLTLSAVLVSLLGALVLVGLTNFLRCGRIR